MTNDQIKYMVDRFLGWRLPENFNPDAGISFERTFNEHTPYPMKHEPVGTNLFDASQAEQMVRYMVEGMPNPSASPSVREAAREAAEQIATEMESPTAWVNTNLADLRMKTIIEQAILKHIPQGYDETKYQMVPKEPTEEMSNAGRLTLKGSADMFERQ